MPFVKRIALRFFFLTKREYFLDFFITPPITAALLAYSVLTGFGLLWIPKFAAGWFLWTLYEYVTHRWVSHRVWGLRDMHWLHHRNQRDYIALHPSLTVAIYFTFWFIFGASSSAFSIGFSVGYLVYAALHTAFHYARIEVSHPLYRLKTRHVAHHRYDDVCFGVSTGIWDKLFRTQAV